MTLINPYPLSHPFFVWKSLNFSKILVLNNGKKTEQKKNYLSIMPPHANYPFVCEYIKILNIFQSKRNNVHKQFP